MNLWIRSQDKIVLMKVDTLSLAIDEEGTILGCGTDGNIKGKLANYKTNERALEVLDEIQAYINSDVMFNLNVFEMPKE